ncbi:MAG: SpoIIE family protein phosphatase [Paeniclostridium sp.]
MILEISQQKTTYVKNIPLGVLEDTKYEHSTISIKSSAMICMYTDGIIELKNQHKEEFGIERLEQFLLKIIN